MHAWAAGGNTRTTGFAAEKTPPTQKVNRDGFAKKGEIQKKPNPITPKRNIPNTTDGKA